MDSNLRIAMTGQSLALCVLLPVAASSRFGKMLDEPSVMSAVILLCYAITVYGNIKFLKWVWTTRKTA